MPVPFALAAVPLIYSAAAAAGSSSAATAVAVTASGGVSAWLAWIFRKKPLEISTEHQDSLDTQNAITTECLTDDLYKGKLIVSTCID